MVVGMVLTVAPQPNSSVKTFYCVLSLRVALSVPPCLSKKCNIRLTKHGRISNKCCYRSEIRYTVCYKRVRGTIATEEMGVTEPNKHPTRLRPPVRVLFCSPSRQSYGTVRSTTCGKRRCAREIQLSAKSRYAFCTALRSIIQQITYVEQSTTKNTIYQIFQRWIVLAVMKTLQMV